MGLRPKPHSRTFLPKSPRDPKKTNWIRYILSSIDSEQGCQRQPCFLFGADSTAPHPPRRPDAPRARRATPHPPPLAPPFLPRSLCAPHICTARALTAHTSVPLARLATRTRRSPCCAHSFTRRSYLARRAHPAHRPRLNSLVHPTKVLKLRTFSFLQSISNFVVGLPNLSKRCEGATVPARTTLALRNCHSVSDFIVSLPNVSKKDVKGLLFRK